MARLALLLLALAAATTAAASTLDLLGVPRGAEPLFAAAKAQGKFACLTDKKIVIPFAKVNDNYCDCPDGSDEPGTSACAPHGRFYCLNQGHTGASIPSSKVNDGVCELSCCDGSDEAPGVCPNRCAALAAVKAKERAVRRKLVEGGIAKKKEYIQEGSSMMEARFKELASMQAQKVKLEKQITEARTQKEVEESREMVEQDKAVQEAAAKLRMDLGVEKKEKEQLIALYHELNGRSGKALKVVLAEIKAKAGMEGVEEEEEEEDEEEGGVVGMTEERREKEAEELKERHIKRMEAWKKGKKEGTFSKKQLGPVPADDDDGDDEDEEEDEDEEDLFDDEDEEEEDEEGVPATIPAAAGENKKKGKKEQEELNPILKDMLKEAEEGANKPLPSAEAAREALKAAEKEEREMGERIRELQAEGDEDYGSGFEFYLLRGKCFSRTVNKYRYEMCPYKEAQQLEGEAVSGTRLGRWEGMEQVNGTKPGEITFKFLFRHGAKCWNGPERSLTVLVSCGVEDEVVSVDEPSMCEYTMDFRTPAACSTALLVEEEEEGGGEGWHVEL